MSLRPAFASFWIYLRKRMIFTVVLQSLAIVAAIVDEPVIKSPPFFLRHDCHKVSFNTDWVLKIGEIEADCEASDMRIDRDTFGALIQI